MTLRTVALSQHDMQKCFILKACRTLSSPGATQQIKSLAVVKIKLQANEDVR